MRFKLIGVVSVVGFAIVAVATYLLVAGQQDFPGQPLGETAQHQPSQQTSHQIAHEELRAGQREPEGIGSQINASVVPKSDFQRQQDRDLQPAQRSVLSQYLVDTLADDSANRQPSQPSDMASGPNGRGVPVAGPPQGGGMGSQANGANPSGQAQYGLQQTQPVQMAQTAPPPAPAVNGNRPAMPDEAKMMILIRTTVLALNEANKTNNYSVLHQLGAPGFQRGNSPERLSEIFAAMRERNLDLGPVAIIPPKLFREPAIDERGRLLLTGFFPSRPEQVNYDLAFEMVDGDWRLFGIGVNTSREVPAAAAGGRPVQ
jgi:hypothetical protein